MSHDRSLRALRLACDEVEFRTDSADRVAFRRHLNLIAEAVREIMRVDCDGCLPGLDSTAIRACLTDGAVLDACVERAHAAAKELREELELACRGGMRTGGYPHG